uniref:Protein kinase domain-containing protein n=1 Tax=Scophthalmus maximus TaxID=52904 RepID=A0A8D3A667_SCOMX
MFQVKRHETLYSRTSRYLVMGLHDEGCFGKVAKCFDLDMAMMVAIKFQREKENGLFQQELAMLEAVRVLDSDKKNIVRFIEHFRFQDLHCLVFEMLDRSLFHQMVQRECMPLSLSEIRPLTHQLLVTLEALKSIGIIHTDIKLDNIMLVNHKDQPFKIKLIDFGLALPVSQVKVGMYMQNLKYRAPEVTLGLPLSEAVDMWGVGCIMTSLYFGTSLFPWDCAYNWIKTMVRLLGQPEDHLLAAGIYKNAIKNFPEKENKLEHKDRMAFLDLLKCCLHFDAKRRISPSEALKQSYLTMFQITFPELLSHKVK